VRRCGIKDEAVDAPDGSDVALVLGTSAAVTLFGYYNAERAVVPVALERVRTQAQARALEGRLVYAQL
jgi:hypothetical protein